MSHLSFFRVDPMSLAAIAAELGATLADGTDPARLIRALAPLDRAGPDDLTAYDDDLAPDDLRETRAGACLVAAQHRCEVPPGTAALLVERPLHALTRLAARLHPASLRPGSQVRARAIDPTAHVAAGVRLEDGVVVDPGACIGPDAEIGAGTFVGAGSLVGAGVRIGRHCAIDAGVTLVHALVGDRVVIHAGARLGQPASRTGDARPSLGRVILQNDVEIGANAVVPRGATGDTIVGEGACLAALVDIAADSIVARGVRIERGREPR